MTEPGEKVDDAEVMRIWRKCRLPEYFLGNGGSNHKLVAFANACALLTDRPAPEAALEWFRARADWDTEVGDHARALLAVAKDAKRLREALQNIANGDGAYGAQAFEYKQIARAALRL